LIAASDGDQPLAYKVNGMMPECGQPNPSSNGYFQVCQERESHAG